ncbi:MAG: TolC family protein [Chthoniobacteraceae bacterium]|nr:TolC family protein [Chthoniobacteraceae bacterium]
MKRLPLLLLPLLLFLMAGRPSSRAPSAAAPPHPTPSQKPIACPTPAGTLPLTLDMAIAIALRQNPTIHSAKAEIERTKGLVIEVRSQLLPQVNLSAIYQQEARELVSGMAGAFGTANPIAGAGAATPTPSPVPTPTPSPVPVPTPTPNPTPKATPPPSVFVQDKTWQVTVQASQLLYSGGRVTAAIRMAKLSRDVAGLKLRDTIDTVVADVRSQFYQVLVTRALIIVQEETVTYLSAQWKDQKKRYATGSVPWFNVLQAEVALANARPALIQARCNYHIAQLTLAKTLGWDTSRLPAWQEPFQAVGGLSIPSPSMDLTDGLRTARERNPFLESQRVAICIELQDILVQKAGYKPTLNANVGYTVENDRLSNSLGDAVHGWFFSIQGNWTIFDGLETYGRVKQARARLEQAKANYDDSVQKTDLQVQQAWANLLQARETIDGGRETVRQAKEALRLARERLSAGAGTQLDVLNAVVQLTQAHTTELQARATYNTALAEFDRVTAVAVCEENPIVPPKPSPPPARR